MEHIQALTVLYFLHIWIQGINGTAVCTTSIGIHRLWLYTGIIEVSYGANYMETSTLEVRYEDAVVQYLTHLLGVGKELRKNRKMSYNWN